MRMLPNLVRLPDPRCAFERALARGVLIHDPPCAIDFIRHWICLGGDRRGNVWFRHCNTSHCLVMPPEAPPDIYTEPERPETEGSETEHPACASVGISGTGDPRKLQKQSRHARPAAIIPFPATSPDATSPNGGTAS